ncbi:MAG TPA: NUDIX hydrolase [Solirubrobacterales bacterium]
MKRLGSETVFRGRVFDVARRRFRRSDGSEVEREVVEHPGSVAIVAHDEELVHLVRQPREAIEDPECLEIPAGTLDVEGESELDCAARELREEADLEAHDWRLMHVLFPSPGYVAERIAIYEATGLSAGPGRADEDGRIAVVSLPMAEIERVLPEIHDAKTWVGLALLRDGR